MRNIETERLLLTPWTMSEEDIEGLYAYACDPDVGPVSYTHLDVYKRQGCFESIL